MRNDAILPPGRGMTVLPLDSVDTAILTAITESPTDTQMALTADVWRERLVAYANEDRAVRESFHEG